MVIKIKNIIIYLFGFVGIILVMFGGSALDSEDIVLPIKICLAGIVLLFVPALMLNLKNK